MKMLLVAFLAVVISGLGFARAEEATTTTTTEPAKITEPVKVEAVKKEMKAEKKHAKKHVKKAEKKIVTEEKKVEDTAPPAPPVQ